MGFVVVTEDDQPEPDQGEGRTFVLQVMLEDGPALRRFVLAHTRDAAETDDVLQDIYLRILQNWRVARFCLSRRAYLFSVARNLLRDRYRHNQVRARALAEMTLQDVGKHMPPLQEHVIRAREGKAAVDKAMERLRPKHREIYCLSRMEGLRHSDIASRLGISLRSVERHASEIEHYMRETLSTCI